MEALSTEGLPVPAPTPTTGSPPRGLLERLRHETRREHEAMESVFRRPRSRADHRHWTEVFFGFLAPLEEAVAARLPAADPLIAGRAKTPWLRADLAALGLDDHAVARLPRATALPRLDPLGCLLGTLYVFEGSTLGGQLIARHLETTLGFADGVGYRYFRSYGADVPRRWQDFRAQLLARSAPEVDDDIVEGARVTFTTLRRWCESRP